MYLVGGALREALLGGVPRDYDFALCSPGDLGVIERFLGTRAFPLGRKPLQTHRMVLEEGTTIDVTFLEGTIEEDLLRRDFTMNAVAWDIRSGTVIDITGGLRDISGRLIRFPGSYTIRDDPLRMLKAARHFATLKDFSIDADLVRAMTEMGPLINVTAPERVKYELDLIITSRRAHEAMRLMEATGLLFEVFPPMRALREMDEEKKFDLETLGHTLDGFRYLRRFSRACGLDESGMRLSGYALLFHDLGKAQTFSYDSKKKAVHFFFHEKRSQEAAQALMTNLRFSSHDTRAILTLIANHMRIFLITASESGEKAVRRLVFALGDLSPHLIALTLCDMYGSSGGVKNASTGRVERRCREVFSAYEGWKKAPLPPLVTGHDLLSLGFRQGPLVGKVLGLLREKQIAGEVTERAGAIAIALGFLGEQGEGESPGEAYQ